MIVGIVEAHGTHGIAGSSWDYDYDYDYDYDDDYYGSGRSIFLRW
jgi:hypothetical protein